MRDYFRHSDAFEIFVRPSDEEISITRMLDKVIRRSDVVDKESLCILAGQRVSFPLPVLCTMEPIVLLGMAPSPHIPFPGRCRECTGLCLPGRDSSAKTLSKTGCWSHWRRGYYGTVQVWHRPSSIHFILCSIHQQNAHPSHLRSTIVPFVLLLRFSQMLRHHLYSTRLSWSSV